MKIKLNSLWTSKYFFFFAGTTLILFAICIIETVMNLHQELVEFGRIIEAVAELCGLERVQTGVRTWSTKATIQPQIRTSCANSLFPAIERATYVSQSRNQFDEMCHRQCLLLERFEISKLRVSSREQRI